MANTKNHNSNDNNNVIIQWNCRGLRANIDELNILIQLYNPAAICLQEIKLNNNNTSINFKNYNCYYNINNCNNNQGGVMICTRIDLPHSLANAHPNLQAITCRISLHQTILISSLYLPPNAPIDTLELENFMSQGQTPHIVLGDFNAHSPLWGSTHLSIRGKIVEDIIQKDDMYILNKKQPTYLHPGTGSFSAIDLALCSPALATNFDWKVHNDQCGSDHYPVLITELKPIKANFVPKFKIEKADWTTFKSLCNDKLNNTNRNIKDIDTFTKVLLGVAEESIPKTRQKLSKPVKVWFNANCKEAVLLRRKTLNIFKKSPTPSNLAKYRQQRAKTRKTIREERRNSWQSYASKLTQDTNTKKVWDMIYKIQGRYHPPSVNHLTVGNKSITDVQDIANTLAKRFSENSSNTNYENNFNRHRDIQEKKAIKFNSTCNEPYNIDINHNELTDALAKVHDSSPGPDKIHYEFLKHLPDESLNLLIRLLNEVLRGNSFPRSWSHATVVPIPKPDKDHTNPTNYRPISLTSCLCKIFEKIINKRLIYYLESNNMLAPTQSGFRTGRSTLDHLVRLETYVREGMVNREHVVAVLFDLEKAYDMTWRYGILSDLYNAGLRGNLPRFIEKFISHRTFQVRFGCTLSDIYELENGVPQGSILSVTLFGLRINSIVRCVIDGVENFLFVDDFGICCRSKNMRTIERKLQLTLNNLQKWCGENGFRFSESKTVCIHFCNQRKIHNEPLLMLHNSPVQVVKEHKFLGMIFDNKLTFIPHLKYLRARCSKSLNLMRAIAHKDWGGDFTTLRLLYRALIRSKLDYGSIVYGAARKSYLQMLEPVQNQGIRLCLGAFRTSPIDSMHVESNELPLHLRRLKLSLNYYLRLRANPSHPTAFAIEQQFHKNLFGSKPHVIRPFWMRMENVIEQTNWNLVHIAHKVLPNIATHLLKRPKVCLDLHTAAKADEPPQVAKHKFLEYINKIQDNTHIFTDGSKDQARVVAAAVCNGAVSSCRLPEWASIFTAEARALYLAATMAMDIHNPQVTIFSDSLSCLEALKSFKLEHPVIISVVELVNSLIDSGKSVTFCWIPSHVGIKGNETADKAAKSALSHALDETITIPYHDYKPYVSKLIKDKMQLDWNNTLFNKLHGIKDTIGETKLPRFLSRRDEVVIHRLRLGHSYVTHSHLLRREPPPECPQCGCLVSIKHILAECPLYNNERAHYLNNFNFKDILSSLSIIKNAILFLKDIQIYNNI